MSMDLGQMVSGKLDRLCHKYDFILIKDYQNLLDLPESYLAGGETKPHRVIRCCGNLSFRLEYEPLRYTNERLIVHVVSDSCFIPDLEARASLGGQVLVISLQSLLSEATGDREIPTKINDYASMAKRCFEGIAKYYSLFKEEGGTILTDAQLQRIILSAFLGAKLFGKVEPPALWNLCFERRQQIEELRGQEIYGEFLTILDAAPWPLSSLGYEELPVVRRTLWLAAILSQHLEDVSTFLSQLHTSLLPQEEFSSQDGENLARELYDSYPELARRQIAETERELTATSIQLLVEKLESSVPERALEVVLEEEYSHLVLMLALYHILLSLSDSPEFVAPETLGRLRGKLADMAVEGLPYELKTYIDLLNKLVDIVKIRERIEPQIDQLAQKSIKGFISPEPFFRTYVEEEGYRLGIYSAEIRRILSLRIEDFPSLSHEFVRSSWDRFRRGIEEQTVLADGVLGKLEEVFAEAVARHYTAWLEGGEVTSAVDVIKGALSTAQEAGYDRAYLLIFEGMRWGDWELHIRPLFAARYEIEVKPVLSRLFLPDRDPKRLRDTLRTEGIRFKEGQRGLSLWLEAEGFELIVLSSQWEQGKTILDDELDSRAIVFIASGHVLEGSGPKLEEAILPLATLQPKVEEGERGLFVSQLRLKNEYLEGLEDSFTFSVRYMGENPFELVDVEVETEGLAQVKPFQVLATKEEKEIRVPFTFNLTSLSEEEKGLPSIERSVKLCAIHRKGGSERYITRYETLRLRLKKGAFAREKDLTLDKILGIKPKK